MIIAFYSRYTEKHTFFPLTRQIFCKILRSYLISLRNKKSDEKSGLFFEKSQNIYVLLELTLSVYTHILTFGHRHSHQF